MKVIVVGARGSIGRHACDALEAAGCTVVRAARDVIDYMHPDVAAWRAAVEGIDAVVNAAGVFRETSASTFDRIHGDGPIALFTLCAERGVPVVQVLKNLPLLAAIWLMSVIDAERARWGNR